jgi:Cysteine-rich secretory protein family/LysM domain
MRRTIFRILAPFIIILLLVLASSMSSRAQAGDPYSLIDAVNGLRAANGLPAYQVNTILMSIAQVHSDYQASIGQVTHIGPGGTRPRDRAVAAGYGGGGTFFISENIAGGTDLSVDGVISMWLGDDPHIQTMLGANYREIGAGVAVSDGFVYYTIDVAYVAGGNYVPPATSLPGGPTALPYYAVMTTTPNSDGSIVHNVMAGQNLTLIAKAYGITVAELKELNHLTSDAIYVGDILIIRLANTPGPSSTPTGTSTPTRAATATRNPTRTPSPTVSPPATAPPTNVAALGVEGGSQSGTDSLGNILVIAIIALAVGGVILMLLGSVLKRSPKN